MLKYLNVINKSELFAGIKGHDIASMLECLQAREAKYFKNERILRAGEPAGFMGLLLEGSAFIAQEDFGETGILLQKWSQASCSLKRLPASLKRR